MFQSGRFRRLRCMRASLTRQPVSVTRSVAVGLLTLLLLWSTAHFGIGSIESAEPDTPQPSTPTPSDLASAEEGTYRLGHDRVRPTGLIWDESTELLRVSCEGTGDVLTIDPVSLEVVRADRLGQKLVDFRAIPGHAGWFLLLDAGTDQLLAVRSEGVRLRVTAALPIPADGVRLHISGDGKRAFVTSRWSHQLTVVDIDVDTAEPLQLTATRDLPFAPRELLWLPKAERLLIADAFRCRVAIVEPQRWTVAATRIWPGHNIRGLATDGKESEIHVVQQHLNPKALADFDDVTWGILLFNGVRMFATADFLDPAADLIARDRIVSLGTAEDHAGDPGPVDISPEGTLTLLYQGAGEVAYGSSDYHLREVEVGEKPVAVAWHKNRKTLFVANQLSDSVSVIDTVNEVLIRTIPLATERPLTPAERGEQLFYSSRISLDNWMSCSSCHTDGHTVDELVDTLGDGDYGAPKRIPSLLGVGTSAPWAWTGNSHSLTEQVLKSITTTMHGPPVDDGKVADLVAYLNSLPPPPARPQSLKLEGHDRALQRGAKQFVSLECVRCHTPPSYTSDGVYDVGFADESGRQEFNPPSLLGVGQRSRFLHDGRASTLREVFSKHQHQLREPISENELDDLTTFLESLTIHSSPAQQ